MSKLDLRPATDFEDVVLGIDPREGPHEAAAMRETLMEHKDAGADRWHYLTGGEAEIRKVTDSIGFRYFYDEKKDEYAHAAGIVLLAPDGRIARYFPGIEFPARDLKFGLIEAADGKIGSLADRVFLLCYDYDPETGKYTVTVLSAVRVVAVVTTLILGVSIGLALLREHRRTRRRPE